MVYAVADRTRRALAQRTCLRNICLRTVRTWIGVGAKYPTARLAFRATKHRHTDLHPPEGVPVWFQKDSALRDPFGHIAYSLGKKDSQGRSLVRTTDYPRGGVVGTVSIEQLSRAWGKPYRGWSDDLNGAIIRATTPAPGVSLSHLRYGAVNADVKILQAALNRHLSGHDIAVTGHYDAATDAAVRRCQSAHDLGHDAAGHSSVGPRQAAHLGLRVG
jgi:Putative peptidoglycan binding domain